MNKSDLNFGDIVKCHDERIGVVWYPEWTLGVLVKFKDESYQYYFANNIKFERM